MGVLRRLLEVLIDTTRRIDEEVTKGYDLSNWGEQMKYLHALQIQAQTLIDIVLRLCSLLGHPPTTPLDAAKYLYERKLLTSEELKFFRKVLGFRNIVIHSYTSVNLRVVDKILKNREYRNVMKLAKDLVSKVREDIDP